MLAEKALELVRESERSRDALGPFNEDSMRQVLEEMRALFESNQREVERTRTISSAIHVRHAALERNKRCLLSYIHGRASKIRDMRWQFGAVLPPEIKSNLCEPEVAFFVKYNRDLATYMRSIGDGAAGGVDLMTDQHPPKSLYVEVRCVQDYGELETDDGEVVVLKKNTQHFLPRSQCEQLIRQGILQHVNT